MDSIVATLERINGVRYWSKREGATEFRVQIQARRYIRGKKRK